MSAFLRWHKGVLGAAVLAGSLVGTSTASAQVVPGTGILVNTDDLEDPKWGYVHNWPKSSKEEDEQIRHPLGAATNRKWSESPKRGSPDVVKRVETPPGGLEGSTGALYLRTRDSGIPGRPGGKQAQDDFILSAKPMRVGAQPNYTVRVFLPEWDQWEQRNGVTFGIRAGMQGPMEKEKPVSFGRRLFKGTRMEKVTEMEPYYPGFFIQFNPKSMPGNKEGDHALILIRSDGLGHEVPGPKITATGWWTFGMSVSPDARCHFFASPGVDDLTAKDHIYSSLPYGIRGETFNTIFFNVCSADNGQTWSTPWIIDDPKVFYYNGSNPPKTPAPIAQQPAPLKTAANPNLVPKPVQPPVTLATPAPLTPVPAAVPAPTGTPMPVATPAPVVTPKVAAPVLPAPVTAQKPAPTAPQRAFTPPQTPAQVPARNPVTAQQKAAPAGQAQRPQTPAANAPKAVVPQPALTPAPVVTVPVPAAPKTPPVVSPAAPVAPPVKAPTLTVPAQVQTTPAAAPVTAIPAPAVAPLTIPSPLPMPVSAPPTRIAQAPLQVPAQPVRTAAPATTPVPKPISAADFFAPPPRAPLAPVNPATQPPSPPPVE